MKPTSCMPSTRPGPEAIVYATRFAGEASLWESSLLGWDGAYAATTTNEYRIAVLKSSSENGVWLAKLNRSQTYEHFYHLDIQGGM